VVLANERDRDAWSRAIPRDAVGVGTLGLIASAAAYSKGGAWLDDTLDRLASNRDLLSALISEHLPRVSYSEPEGTYLAWLDMGPYQLDDPASFILDEARVAVNAGGPFGTGASQFIRFNFDTHGYLIREMVERIGAVLPRP
jgi:cystathionine beta-lyase